MRPTVSKHCFGLSDSGATGVRFYWWGLLAEVGGKRQTVATVPAEVKLRAERKAGELLGQLERSNGGRPAENSLQPGMSFSEYRTVLTESNVATTTAHRWQTVATGRLRIANLPFGALYVKLTPTDNRQPCSATSATTGTYAGLVGAYLLPTLGGEKMRERKSVFVGLRVSSTEKSSLTALAENFCSSEAAILRLALKQMVEQREQKNNAANSEQSDHGAVFAFAG